MDTAKKASNYSKTVLDDAGTSEKHVAIVARPHTSQSEPIIQPSEEEIEALMKEPHGDKWFESYKQLVKFRLHEGHCCVNQMSGGKLGLWVKKQRALHSRGSLPELKETLLNKLNFEWSGNEASWYRNYDEVAAFKKREGSLPRNGRLCMWVDNQRKLFKVWRETGAYCFRSVREEVVRQRFELLKSIGVI